MKIPNVDLDLSLPPSERWRGLEPHVQAGRRLLDCYVRDLGGLGEFAPLIDSYAQAYVRSEHREDDEEMVVQIP